MPTAYAVAIQSVVTLGQPATIFVALNAPAVAQVVVTVRDSYTASGFPIIETTGTATIPIGATTGILNWTPLQSTTFTLSFSNDSALTNPASFDVAITNLCQLSDIQDIFGPKNIAGWSNLDNSDSTTDTNRTSKAIVLATAKINNFFRGGIYASPLFLNSGFQILTDWAAKIAGIWLFSIRGQLDTAIGGDGVARPFNRYSGMLKDVYKEMQMYRDGEDDHVLDAPLSGAQEVSAFQNVPISGSCSSFDEFADLSCW